MTAVGHITTRSTSASEKWSGFEATLNLGDVGHFPCTCRITGPSTYARFAHACLLRVVLAIPLFGQSNVGELRLKIADPDGLGVKTTVHIVSAANQYRNNLATGEHGSLIVQRLPYGIYQLEIRQPGFAVAAEVVEIHSSIPTEYAIRLRLPSVNQSVTVSGSSLGMSSRCIANSVW